MTLIILVFIVGLAATGYLLHALHPDALKTGRDNTTAMALASAKDVLIGYAVVSESVADSFGYLPNPDMGLGSIVEGGEAGNVGSTNASLIGKLPWRTLGIPPLKDGTSECLWYVVSGRFKNNPKTGVLNWDTQGQIDVIDSQGNTLASNLAALLVSPGHPLGSQSRILQNVSSIQCRGNYDAKNYLDPFSTEDAIAGEINYFINSTNNGRASNADNKRFVMNSGDDYNDRFLFVTADEIFRLIIKRSDFSTRITSLLDDPEFKSHLQTVSIEGDKGTDRVECDEIENANNRAFCENWREMLLLTQLHVAKPIFIDDMPTAPCSRVLIFGGQKTATQLRLTDDDKDNPANYLEGSNLSAFDVPTAHGFGFAGTSSFNASNPSADILRCL